MHNYGVDAPDTGGCRLSMIQKRTLPLSPQRTLCGEVLLKSGGGSTPPIRMIQFAVRNIGNVE